ncbi:Aspartate/glutamate leucyltransferase [Bosea thiooxidans]
MSALDFAMMVEDTHVETQLIEYRRRGPNSGFTGHGEGDLFAMALTDSLGDGLSMVYSVYDPAWSCVSLGTFMVLNHVARARRPGCLTSISAIGSPARRKSPTNPAFCRRSG